MDNEEKGIVKKGIKSIIVIWLIGGFLFFQIAALVLLSIISVERSEIQDRIEEGVDYLSVTITWTDCRQEKTRKRSHGKLSTETRYYNTYSYTVNGVEYYDTVENVPYSVVVGEQETRYYNPNDPNVISGYRSVQERVEKVNGEMVSLCTFFQTLAIVSLVIFVLILVLGKKK